MPQPISHPLVRTRLAGLINALFLLAPLDNLGIYDTWLQWRRWNGQPHSHP